jgi:peptidoglycan/xylan/chitin deacetylase (PgdA/CDA1 family)
METQMMRRVSNLFCDVLKTRLARGLASAACAVCATYASASWIATHASAQASTSASGAAQALSRPPIAPLVARSISMTPPVKQEMARREAAPSGNVFHALTYHDVYTSFNEKREVGDSGATTAEDMTRHFAWLRDNGYTVVSVQQVIDARSGGKPLPPKSIMLTFDDGYKSFHAQVLPLLKLFGYPATLAVISGWIDDPSKAHIEYESTRTIPSQFMSWDEIRDCIDSGLVEIASHTHDLHHGVQGNAQGNKQPAAITRRYDPATASYETETAYAARVRSDLARNSDVLAQRLGKRPRVIAWPYGAYNATTQQIAAELGMAIGFTLENGANSDETSLAAIRRDLIHHDSTTYSIAAGLRPSEIYTQRVITIDIAREFVDYNSVDERPLSSALERLQKLRPSLVILRDNAQSSRESNKGAVSFQNTVLPTRMNLLNRVAWQLRTRGSVRVFVEDPSAGLNERDRTTLLNELGRYNFFAGLVRDAQSPLSPKADAGFMAIEANQPGFESMYRIKLDAACGESLPSARESKVRHTNNAAFTQWREAVALNHWVLLQVRAEQPANCTLKWWQALAEIAATMPDWQQRTIVELDNDLALEDEAQNVVRPLLNAYTAGFRHYGYANDDMRNDRPALAKVKRAISIEYHPVKQR